MDIRSFRFFYLRDKLPHLDALGRECRGFPVACIASRIDRANNQAIVGLSTVHPNDKGGSFSKLTARKLAIGASFEEPYRINLSPDDTEAEDILYAVMDALYKDYRSTIPNRVRKALKLWLYPKDDMPLIKSYDTIEEAISAIKPPDLTSHSGGSIDPFDAPITEEAV